MFGVPNLGMRNEALLTMTHGHLKEGFARSLGIDSPLLQELDRSCANTLGDREIETLAVYETEDSPCAEVRRVKSTFSFF
jgi:hypothetical protein